MSNWHEHKKMLQILMLVQTSTLSMLWHKVMRHTPAGDKSVVDHW